MSSLAVKYRPKEFSEVCSQQAVVKILEKQVETKTFRNASLFSGASGCGKTTIARIFANMINNNCGEPIEIDAASNNSVENVRLIVEQANERSLDSEYKIFIIDEAHALSNQAWQAFLKTIEEPPKYTIFMFCTTDPQKIPQTIINRCQEFHITRIPDQLITSRLEYICMQENYIVTDEGLSYITKVAEGSMRKAISCLDKCKDFSTEITGPNVVECLGIYDYDTMFELTNARIDGNDARIFEIIELLYLKGSDLKLFINSYLDFILEITKYCLLNDISVIKLPLSMKQKLDYTVNIENPLKFFNKYLDKVLSIKQAIKGDSNAKTTIEVMLTQKGGE